MKNLMPKISQSHSNMRDHIVRARPFQRRTTYFFGTSIFFPRQGSLEDGLSRRTVIARTSSTGIHFEGIGVEKTSGGRFSKKVE